MTNQNDTLHPPVANRGWIVTVAGLGINLALGILYAWSVWKANLLAPAGQGFKLAMETFNQTRPDIGAAATGLMRRCLDECVVCEASRVDSPVRSLSLTARLI